MKSFIIILLAVILFSLAGCKPNTEDLVSQTEETTPTPIPYEDLQPCDTPPSGEIFIP